MRIIAISDTHSMHRQLTIPEGDVLIFSGDMCGLGLEKEVIDFNNWLGEQPCKHKIVIAGNHDYPLSVFPISWNNRLLNNATYLENSECIIDGVKFWGSPITPTFLSWWFMADRGEPIKKYWGMIPKETDVLITHGPAFGILDTTSPKYSVEKVGCKDLLNKIEEVKPKVHIFGHIHGGYNMFNHNGTIFINASSCDEDYQPVNKPLVVDL